MLPTVAVVISNNACLHSQNLVLSRSMIVAAFRLSTAHIHISQVL